MASTNSRSSALSPQRPEITSTARFRIDASEATSPNIKYGNSRSCSLLSDGEDTPGNDIWNYALLVVLYTMQGIPTGLLASIPFLIQQKIKDLVSQGTVGSADATFAPLSSSSAVALSYNANALFALCPWPFSLKLLWAPIVDACFICRFGRWKSWLVPVQVLVGALMVLGSGFVGRQLGLHPRTSKSLNLEESFQVRGVTLFFFVLYFLMATQDIAVDGWALTLLSPKNRGRGPVCNSIGQNIGYFLSFVGFLDLNDVESSERWWRPLFGLKSIPSRGLVSLGSFLCFMGYFMLVTTMAVAVFKKEGRLTLPQGDRMFKGKADDGEDLDASVIGLRETYHRLWAVCQLPAVRHLFVILLTYRLPMSLGDNVKFLKAVEYGLSKSTTALLSPTIILPLGILVPILAMKVWHGHPLRQFMTAFKFRVTVVPLLDVLMLYFLRRQRSGTGSSSWWILCLPLIVLSMVAQAVVQSLQFNSQMTFFAHRVDPAIGGSCMTLLNTATNLGGSWPSSFVLWLISRLSNNQCDTNGPSTGKSACWDPYFAVQAVFIVLGLAWIAMFGRRVPHVAQLPDSAWRTHLLPDEADDDLMNDQKRPDFDRRRTSSSLQDNQSHHPLRNQNLTASVDVELGGSPYRSTERPKSLLWQQQQQQQQLL
jgi:MFS transporter, PAT family, solute carrier family 33 (acetyl-CoA transportor), member 1